MNNTMAVTFGTARNPGGDGHGGGSGHGKRPHDGTFIQHPTVGLYGITYLALLVLLGVTVGLYYIDLSKFVPWHGINLLIAMVVAVVKALFVIRNFMNVQGSTKLVWLWAALGFIWLVLMSGMFLDYRTRTNPLGWQPERPNMIQTGPRGVEPHVEYQPAPAQPGSPATAPVPPAAAGEAGPAH